MMPLAFGPGYSRKCGNREPDHGAVGRADQQHNGAIVPSDRPGIEPALLPGLRARLVDAGYGNAIVRLASEHDIPRFPVGVRDRLREVQERVPGRGRCDAKRRAEHPDRLQLDPAELRQGPGRRPSSDRQRLSRRQLGRLHRCERLRPRSRARVRSASPPAGPAGGGIRRRSSISNREPGLDTAANLRDRTRQRISLPEWVLSGGGYQGGR